MENNVQKFLEKSAKIVGEYHRDGFYREYKCQFDEDEVVTSPIEQLFYVAFETLRKLNDIPQSDEGSEGLFIDTQSSINKYKVDFLIHYNKTKGRPGFDFKNKNEYFMTHNLLSKCVVVECDSQEFHERTEKQRRYEKKRDRELIKKDFKVFHFTGSEIFKNPYLVAKEVLEYLTGYEIECPLNLMV